SAPRFHTGRGPHRHLADVLAGGRAVHLDHLGGRRLGPLAADEKLVVLRCQTVGHFAPLLLIAPLWAPPYPRRSWIRTCSIIAAEGPARDCSPGTPVAPAPRSATMPIAGGSGGKRQPGRRCRPPNSGRRPPIPRTTTIRNRSSDDDRVCGCSAPRRASRRDSASAPFRDRRTARARRCRTAPPDRPAWSPSASPRQAARAAVRARRHWTTGRCPPSRRRRAVPCPTRGRTCLLHPPKPARRHAFHVDLVPRRCSGHPHRRTRRRRTPGRPRRLVGC